MSNTDIRFDVPIGINEAKRRVTALADDLRQLGLLNDDEHTQVETILDRADQAQALGRSAAQTTAHERTAIAQKVASGDLAVTAIRDHAAKLPELEHVVRIAETVFVACIREAETVAYSHTDRAVSILNEQFDALADTAAALAEKLDGVTNAEAAIARGATDEWSEVTHLQSTFALLREIIKRLREVGKLEKSTSGDTGVWWNFRRPPALERGGYRVAADDSEADGGRAKFFREMAAGPYVPATREEARAAAKVHEAAHIEFQSGVLA